MDIAARTVEVLTRHAVAGQRVALALSGGIDSIVLLDIVSRHHTANPSWLLVFQAVHVNHGISPNANKWVEFCVAECAKRSVPITVEVVDVDRASGTGLEAAAREARYVALMKSDAAFILTAQHQDDQAETVLQQMLRGTGLNGLAGMGEARVLRVGQTLLRPMLNFTRAEIETYAATHRLHWVEDESNADTAYTRNFLRHELLPVIAARFPHYADSLARIARHASESAELNEALAKIDLCWDGVDAHADALDALPLTRQVNALYHWLRWKHAEPPSRLQLEAWAEQIFRVAPESKPHQAGGHGVLILRRRNLLVLK